MRLWMTILAVFLLSACGIATEDIGKSIVNVQQDEVKNEAFTFRLVSEKEQYKKGEPLNIVAELINNSDANLEIGHGGSWVWLNTTNLTNDYQFGSEMNEPYIITSIAAGAKISEPYRFSGGTYDAGMLGSAYSDKIFSEMSEMNFPVGQYKISGKTDFRIEGQEKTIQLETEIKFEVVK